MSDEGEHLFVDVCRITAVPVLPVVWQERIMEYPLVQIHLLHGKIV